VVGFGKAIALAFMKASKRDDLSGSKHIIVVSSISDFDATVAETRYFWSWFIFGSIMAIETRRHLWQSWGFCPRHAWLHAVVECEIWGGRPFATSILYQDLIERAARVVDTGRVCGILAARRLRPQATCLVCDYLAIAKDVSADESNTRRCARVNLRSRVMVLIAQSEPSWRLNSCDLCGGAGKVVCRLHLLAGDGRLDRALAAYLCDLERRLGLLIRSMTWRGPQATPEIQASWVEALGWFAGWSFPLAVVSA